MVESINTTNGVHINESTKPTVTKPLRHSINTDALQQHFEQLSVNQAAHSHVSNGNNNNIQQNNINSQQYTQQRQYPQAFNMQSIPQQQYVKPESDYRQLNSANQSVPVQQQRIPAQFQMPVMSNTVLPPQTQQSPQQLQQSIATPSQQHHINTSQFQPSQYTGSLNASAIPFEAYTHATQPIDRLGFQHLFQADAKTSTDVEQKLFSSGNHAGIDFDKYNDIPVECTGNDLIPPVETFTELNFPDILNHNIELCQYYKPTPIQKYALPAAWYGRDLMCCSQTGSGKTAAFLFPLIAALVSRGRAQPVTSAYRCSYPVGLILVPTRELATQIYDEACKFTYRTGYAPVVVYGGADPKFQSHELSYGCDILIATPGRLVDFIQRGRISMSQIGYLVFDEADRMLDMGFEPQIQQILHQYDMNHMTRQTLMFSATFPKEIQKLAAEYLNNYIFIAVGRVGSAAELVTQHIIQVEDQDKSTKLMELLHQCSGLTLIFVERKRQATELERWLRRHQISAVSIHGDKTQHEREYALDMFKSAQCTVLVATDVAARGLDINNVTDVINYDLPTNVDDYVHRIGRTGRAGNTGKAHAFFNEKNMVIAKELIDLLYENKQQVPDFLLQLYQSSRSSSTRGRGRGRGRFGGTDYRNRNQYGTGNPIRGMRGGSSLMQQARSSVAAYQQQQQYVTHNNVSHLPMQSMLPTQMPSQ